MSVKCKNKKKIKNQYLKLNDSISTTKVVSRKIKEMFGTIVPAKKLNSF